MNTIHLIYFLRDRFERKRPKERVKKGLGRYGTAGHCGCRIISLLMAFSIELQNWVAEYCTICEWWVMQLLTVG